MPSFCGGVTDLSQCPNLLCVRQTFLNTWNHIVHGILVPLECVAVRAMQTSKHFRLNWNWKHVGMLEMPLNLPQTAEAE